MTIAVVNSTCLTELSHIGRVDLLLDAFPEIFTPPAVETEVGRLPRGVRIRRPTQGALTTVLRQQLGAGESEAIALAHELQSVVVLDDRKARQTAARLGLRVIGTIGLLLRAKREGRLPLVRPVRWFVQSVGSSSHGAAGCPWLPHRQGIARRGFSVVGRVTATPAALRPAC